MDFLENNYTTFEDCFSLLFEDVEGQHIRVFYPINAKIESNFTIKVNIPISSWTFRSLDSRNISKYTPHSWIKAILDKFYDNIIINLNSNLDKNCIIGDYSFLEFSKSLQWDSDNVSFDLPVISEKKRKLADINYLDLFLSLNNYNCDLLDLFSKLNSDKKLFLSLLGNQTSKNISVSDFFNKVLNDVEIKKFFWKKKILEDPGFKNGLLKSKLPTISSCYLTEDLNVGYYFNKFETVPSVNCAKDEICFKTGIQVFWYSVDFFQDFDLQLIYDSYFLEFKDNLERLMENKKGLKLLNMECSKNNLSDLIIYGGY